MKALKAMIYGELDSVVYRIQEFPEILPEDQPGIWWEGFRKPCIGKPDI